MGKITSFLRRHAARVSAAVAVIAAAIIVPTAVFAWGPDRATYTVANPAKHVTFNSITDNPNYGDERNFVTIKDASNTSAGGWKDEIKVQNGKEYLVRMYVHNNASAELKLVAENVMAQFDVPTYKANKIQIDGYLSASNATPKKVWDQAVFTSDNKLTLSYVTGSAKYTNNNFPNGTKLPDTLISSGAKLGVDKMNGYIPGCFCFDGYVTFKVKATTTDFDVQKTVRLSDASDKTFKESVAAKPGDKVDYQIYFKNTGGTQLKDVVIKDTLPAGVTYVPGSTWLHNAGGTRQVADGITGGGLNIGGYIAGGDAYIKFTVTVNKKEQLPKCGENKLVNVAKAVTSDGSKEDTATVTVKRDCDETTVSYTCDALTVKKISNTEYVFTAGYNTTNATFKNVVFVVKDGKGAEVDRITSTTASYTYKKPLAENSKVEATITVTVDGKDKTVTSANCVYVVPPSELPKTGAGSIILSILGLGAIVASLGYYLASRRAARNLA